VADAQSDGRGPRGTECEGQLGESASNGAGGARPLADAGHGEHRGREGLRHADEGTPGPTNGFWADAEWLPCRDGKARPTQPGLFPLAHGATQRVRRLRAYGNAIVAPQAIEFITAYMEEMQ
jgi:DNA (cytosine-5)-methyltransferase 1